MFNFGLPTRKIPPREIPKECQCFLQNTWWIGGGLVSLLAGIAHLCCFYAAEKSPQKTLRFSPGDGGSFLAELQQAIEDDKVTL